MNEKRFLNCFSETYRLVMAMRLFAGLERILDYLKDFHFSESDLAYLKEELGYKDDFIILFKRSSFYGRCLFDGRRGTCICE